MKTIEVVSCKEWRSGTTKKGKPWTIYHVNCRDENGAKIEEFCKSFSYIPEGVARVVMKREEYEGRVSYLVEHAADAEYGADDSDDVRTSEPQQFSMNGAIPATAELMDRIEKLEGEVRDLAMSVANYTREKVEEEDAVPF